jgi:uncharacterized membrane protein YoaK (UPF0700 family)
MTVPETTADSGMALPVALSLIAGVTDVSSWLLLGGFFSAHVTGNIVVIAADVVSGRAPDTVAVLAIPVFIVITGLASLATRRIGGTVVTRSLIPRPGARAHRSMTLVLLGSQSFLLMAAAGLSFTGRASLDPAQPLAVGIGLCAVSAMAVQNAYLHLVPARAASTAVMTGNLVTGTIAAVDLVLSRGASASARLRCRQSWPLVAGFLGGCLIGSAAATLFSDRAAALPAVLAVLVFAIIAIRAPATTPSERSV